MIDESQLYMWLDFDDLEQWCNTGSWLQHNAMQLCLFNTEEYGL